MRTYVHKTSNVLTAVLTASTALLLKTTPVFAQVAGQTRAWSGRCTDDGTATGVATIQGLECLLANVLSVAVMIIGLAGFVMLIIAAFRYMISGGDSKTAESTRNTLTFAVVGIVVALSAFIILNLISQFTGVDTILQFALPDSNAGF